MHAKSQPIYFHEKILEIYQGDTEFDKNNELINDLGEFLWENIYVGVNVNEIIPESVPSESEEKFSEKMTQLYSKYCKITLFAARNSFEYINNHTEARKGLLDKYNVEIDFLQKNYEINMKKIFEIIYFNTENEVDASKNRIKLMGATFGMVTIIERILTDFLMNVGNSTEAPRILRDLLRNPTLQGLLSNYELIFLHIIFGPPISLNLRNLICHGFFLVIDPDLRLLLPFHNYSNLVFHVILHITSKLLQTASEKIANDLLKLSFISVKNYKFVYSNEAFTLLDTFRSLSEEEKNIFRTDLSHIFETNYFTFPEHVNLIEFIFNDYFDTSIKQNGEGSFGFQKNQGILNFLLPIFEQNFRRLFIIFNNLPEALIQASPNCYYSTLDLFVFPTFVIFLFYHQNPNILCQLSDWSNFWVFIFRM